MSAFDRYPRVINQIEELPEREQHALQTVMPQGGCEGIVFFPPFDNSLSRLPVGRHKAAEADEPHAQIWAYKGRQLCVLAAEHDTISGKLVALDNILTFELGEILLHSWIELKANSANETCTTRVEFNSVGMRWLEPLIEMLRGQCSHAISETPVQFPPELQAQITRLPYKWKVILRDELGATGEPLIAFAYEPSVPRRLFWRGGREGHLLILTPKRFVKITEPLESYPHGKVATWYLRAGVQAVSFDTTDRGARLDITFAAPIPPLQIEMRQNHVQELQAVADGLAAKRG